MSNKQDPRSPAAGDNPVVQEVRETRERLWREAGGTSRGYIELVRRRRQQAAVRRIAEQRGKKSA